MNLTTDEQEPHSFSESAMSEAEMRAYTAGYNSAARLLKGLIDHWAELNESHRYCNCAICLTLRDVANGRFGSMEIAPVPENSHTH